MTLFDLPESDPQPFHRNQPTRPIDPDNLRRGDIERLMPNLDINSLTAWERSIVKQVVAEALRSPADLCQFRGCVRPRVDGHHPLTKRAAGQLAECVPLIPFCKLHHEFVHIVDRHELPHSSACQCEGRGWISVEDPVLGDLTDIRCPGVRYA